MKKPKPKLIPTRQCFRLSDDLMEALSVEEIDATWQAMQEFDIARLPCPEFDIIVSGRFAIDMGQRYTDRGELSAYELKFREIAQFRLSYTEGRPIGCQVLIDGKGPNMGEYTPDWLAGLGEGPFYNMMVLLVVLLGTTAAKKTVKENKLAKLGIGKNAYAYTTTITIGHVEGSSRPGVEGSPKRPHFRRGHPRTLRRDTPNERRVFVQPCFIHADREYIETRTGYDLRKR